jgi:hypothetical protein
MRRKTYNIICNNCGKRVFRYVKFGKGRIIHCWKNRILEDNSINENKKVKCVCGNLIGVEKKKRIEMKQHSFTVE